MTSDSSPVTPVTPAQVGRGTRPPSVKDVATLAQVSVGTVSNVINGRGSVRPNIRERVEGAIKELGYVPNPTAQALRRGTSPLVGVAILDLQNPFFMEAAAAMEKRLSADGCVMALSATGSDPTLETKLLRTLAGQAPRGILLTPASSSLETAQEIVERGIPVVLFDCPETSATMSSVSVDDLAGAEMAIDHLLDLGHTRICMLNGPSRVRQAGERLEGAQRAIDRRLASMRNEAGPAATELPTLQVRELTAFTAEAGRDAMRTLLDEAGIPVVSFVDREVPGPPEPPELPEDFPTAFFCANDLIAFGALTVLRDAGIRVPNCVSLVGFDDIAMAAQMSAPLTTVRQPMEQIGWEAADLLLSAGTEGRIEHKSLTPSLVVRASTGAPRPRK